MVVVQPGFDFLDSVRCPEPARRFPLLVEADSNEADVPDDWDPYIGVDRLDRARSFTAALQRLGADVALTVFANTDHSLTDEMRAAGCNALAAAAA